MQVTQNKNYELLKKGVIILKEIGGKIGVFLFKDFAIPVTGLVLTVGGIWATIYAAEIQADASIKAAHIQANVTEAPAPMETRTLIDFVDRLNSPNLSDPERKLVEAQLFIALRNLDSKGKGYLIRFLHEGEFIKANQQGISLSGANLQEINLQDAWMPDIDLKGAYISKGNLSQTNLKRANLREADLTGADLTGADLTDARLEGAKYDNQTKFPNGFYPVAANMTKVS